MSSKVVVYGGSGHLGAVLVSLFKKNNWEVTSVGTRPNSDANHNIVVSVEDSLEVQGEKVLKQVSEQLQSGEKYDVILNVSGGFTMGNTSSKGSMFQVEVNCQLVEINRDFLLADFLKSADIMISRILYSSLVSAQLAAHHLKSEGLLTLTGVAHLKGTPGYIGYGVAKAGVHQLFQSLVNKGSGLPKNVKVTALLPFVSSDSSSLLLVTVSTFTLTCFFLLKSEMIDTPLNRQIMPNADFSNFTPMEELSNRLYGWASGSIPVNHGTLLEVSTKKGITTFTEISKSE
ncbi:7129_t:CDS:2 [Acaulospora morrowiae]|uniref:7129_t:CDS:1 n=1 Tax=Acaulospora morrowiae TaxID=94023 RepID=A0A9N9FAL9_9GLOM|nr:7129_t:CDS:2 [Acaulospora morrowiae]